MTKKIAVWFSCGAASAVAAKLTLDQYPDDTVWVVNNPVLEEDADNIRFLHDVEAWLGVKIEPVIHPHFPDCSAEDVWRRERYMSGVHGAPCTRYLKKRARQVWENSHAVDFHVLGFTADEQRRHERFVLSERDNVLPILIDAGMNKQDCINYLQRQGLRLPRVYAMGYPNANCIGCVKATSPTYWNHVRRYHPAVFTRRAGLSRKLGVRLTRVKGDRVFLDELSPTAKGNSMKSMEIDCGIFCEETDT